MMLLNNLTLGLRLSREEDGQVYLHDRRYPDEFTAFTNVEDATKEYDRRLIVLRRTSTSSWGG